MCSFSHRLKGLQLGKESQRKRLRYGYLPKLTDHAGIKTTIDRYVHVTSESMDQAIKRFQLNGVSA